MACKGERAGADFFLGRVLINAQIAAPLFTGPATSVVGEMLAIEPVPVNAQTILWLDHFPGTLRRAEQLTTSGRS